MEKIRIGIIGSGGMATRRAAPWAQLDGCVLQAIAARNSRTGPGDRWQGSITRGVEDLPDDAEGPSLEERFLDDVLASDTGWQDDFRTALQTVRISLAAETSIQEGRRVALAAE